MRIWSMAQNRRKAHSRIDSNQIQRAPPVIRRIRSRANQEHGNQCEIPAVRRGLLVCLASSLSPRTRLQIHFAFHSKQTDQENESGRWQELYVSMRTRQVVQAS